MSTDKYASLDDQGREIPDDTPIVVHLSSGPVGDFDRIRAMIREQLSLQAENQGMETLEEANDFDVDDDMFPVSPHEYAEGTEKADLEALHAERARRASASTAPSGAGVDGLDSSRPTPSAAAPAVEGTSGSAVQAGPAT